MPYGWNSNPSKVDIKNYTIEGDKRTAVAKVGRYSINISFSDNYEGAYPIDNLEVSYTSDDRRYDDPRDTFPNMSIYDGVLQIPVEDVVGEILQRIEPVDLATALWANDDVRAQFMECLTQRYSGDSVTDEDRRSFLHAVNVEIYDKRLDGIKDVLSGLEHAVNVRAYYWDHVNQVNDRLRMVREQTIACYPDAYPEFGTAGSLETLTQPITGPDQTADLKVAGKSWQEARDYWRAKLDEMFPKPVLPSASEEKLRVALEQIASGSFPNAGAKAMAGGVVFSTALQEIAGNALKTPDDEAVI